MHKGFAIAVFTRSEHCPPHVHVGNDRWDARFEFSFWHNGVRLWDVIPQKNQPTVALLEGIRQTMLLPDNLRRAREVWWGSVQTVCLVNHLWNDKTCCAEVNRLIKSPAKLIRSATFDVATYRTILILAGQAAPCGDPTVMTNIPAGFDAPLNSLVLEKAITAGRNRKGKLHATTVQYHPALASLLISFADGCALALPVKNYPEFSMLNTRQLEQVSVSFAGTALCLDTQDLHVSITGLISASPSLLEMATSVVAARNGSRRSNAKAHTSRENGKKGGRPRKSV